MIMVSALIMQDVWHMALGARRCVWKNVPAISSGCSIPGSKRRNRLKRPHDCCLTRKIQSLLTLIKPTAERELSDKDRPSFFKARTWLEDIKGPWKSSMQCRD